MGYQTTAFVTNGAVGKEAGFAQGFDSFFEPKGEPYMRASDLTDQVIDWLDESRNNSEKLFLYVHYLDPHMPYLSGGGKGETFYNFSAYKEELLYVNKSVRRLIERIKLRLPDPVILITSDHGEEFGEHGIYGHGHSLYEEAVHIPLILHYPDHGAEGSIIESKLEGRDFFDLLVRVGGGEKLSVKKWSEHKSRETRYSSVYLYTGFSQLRPYLANVCMRRFDSGDHTLIWSAYGDTYEMYNLNSDPGFFQNLASDRPELTRKLTAQMTDEPEFWLLAEPFEPTRENIDQLKALGYMQ